MDLLAKLQYYKTDFSDEQAMCQAFISFLQQYGKKAYERQLVVGHVTASAILLDKIQRKVLLLHHAKLGKWLPPGGHADGELETLTVALKETLEEASINQFAQVDSGIFDVDIHTIPARKQEAEHLHYNIAHLLRVKKEAVAKINHESLAYQWASFEQLCQLEDQPSLQRVGLKLQKMLY